MGVRILISRLSRIIALRNCNQCGPNDSVIQNVALLHYMNHGVGRKIGLRHANCLMLMRVELLALRIDHLEIEFIEGSG
jgi:hypothetical protein